MKSYKEGKFSDLFYFELLSRSLGKRGYPRETKLLHIVTEAVSAPLELIRFQAEELDAQNLNNYKKVGGFVFSFFFYFLQLTESNFGHNSSSFGSLMQASSCICSAAVYMVHRDM